MPDCADPRTIGGGDSLGAASVGWVALTISSSVAEAVPAFRPELEAPSVGPAASEQRTIDTER